MERTEVLSKIQDILADAIDNEDLILNYKADMVLGLELQKSKAGIVLAILLQV